MSHTIQERIVEIGLRCVIVSNFGIIQLTRFDIEFQPREARMSRSQFLLFVLNELAIFYILEVRFYAAIIIVVDYFARNVY